VASLLLTEAHAVEGRVICEDLHAIDREDDVPAEQ